MEKQTSYQLCAYLCVYMGIEDTSWEASVPLV